jgi:hypothetical protein
VFSFIDKNLLSYIHKLLYSCHRGKAKTGKKQKVGGSSKAPEVSKSEKEVFKTSEVPIQSLEEPINPQNDPPPQTDAAPSEAMDTNTNPADSHDPPSPNLIKPAKEIPSKKSTDDVTITGMGYK